MMTSTDSNHNDFVSVEIQNSNSNRISYLAGPSTPIAADEPPENNNNDGGDEESASHRQRSLLKTLWSEATSTTDLHPPLNHRLHHRRTTTNKDAARAAGSSNGTTGMSPSKGRPHRYRVARRGARVAKRVWLAAFAAFATSILIAIHVFLYRVFIGGAKNGSDKNYNDFGTVKRNGIPILAVEDQEAKMTLAEAHSHQLKPVNSHSIDTSQYTIRINTWQRNEQLLLSINHHAQCEGVKEIQVIWCDATSDPTKEILHHTSGKVKIEKHTINSLNERFKVLLDTPTLGILSLDDDVLRPCVALDAAFVRWTRHPERMVGFDARSHVVVGDDSEKSKRWKYGYMSTTESSNRYSITLPRASFIHRDYLDMYVMALPRPIYKYVAENLECEDIAMSFFVSSLTNGKPPLLADYWAVKSMVKLYSAKKISGGKEHKSTRDACVNDFAELLGIKEGGERPLQIGKLLHKEDQFFGYGAEPEGWSDVDPQTFQSSRLQDVIGAMWKLQSSSSNEERMSWLVKRKAEIMGEAKNAGLIEKSEEWKKRWHKSKRR